MGFLIFWKSHITKPGMLSVATGIVRRLRHATAKMSLAANYGNLPRLLYKQRSFFFSALRCFNQNLAAKLRALSCGRGRVSVSGGRVRDVCFGPGP